ncbi:copper homeostasis protein CutC [Compostibacter hankyongensis]|uniref:PF03932 family protein CutC n=1 Tax=Compostibacter hankyongensis TaxID=1007089 RepID=A0ABP8FJ84_9BACT
MNTPVILEICANSAASAIAAQTGGADRVELCDNMAEGGTTPSYGAIAKTREALSIQVYPIIRPRGGDFLYDALEFELMQRDIEVCKQLGCDGVVIGVLTEDGKVDVVRTKQLVTLAQPMGVTFHRAFDMTSDAFEALEAVISTGCERILTSGQRRIAMEGTGLIRQLVQVAGDRITIMAGSGVREENIAELVRQTGAREYHSRGNRTADSKMQYRNPHAAMGDGKEFEISITDSAIVKRLREKAEAATSTSYSL